MTRMDEDEVRRLAELARLELSDDEVRRLAGELGDLLDDLRRLGEVEVDLPEAPEEEGVRLRPDAPSAEPLARRPETFAPEWRDGFFVLPRIEAMDDEGTSPP